MSTNFDSMLNVSAVPQDDRTAAFIAESKNNRNRCYELSEQITAAVATDSQMFQKYLDVPSDLGTSGSFHIWPENTAEQPLF